MTEKDIRDLVNKILSDNCIDIKVTTDDIRRYMPDMEESENDHKIREKLKCSQETIYFYRRFQKAFNSDLLSAPDIEDISPSNIGFKHFKGLLNDKQKKDISFSSGDDIYLAAVRYRDALSDRDFFYGVVVTWVEFLNRYKEWIDGGSMWVRYQNDILKPKIPFRLLNEGYIDIHDVSEKRLSSIKKEIIDRTKSAKYSSSKPDVEDVATMFETITNEVYNREKVFTNKTMINIIDDSRFKVRY